MNRFPKTFLDRLIGQLGARDAQALTQALLESPTVGVRLNDKLRDVPFETSTQPVPWCSDGLYLAERVPFVLDPLWHAGCYYVQEPSSMLLQQILEQFVPKKSLVLDVCGAPGGKATLISQWLGREGLLVCNEVIRKRMFILSENIQKWGNGNVVVTYNKPADFGTALKNVFNCVVVDAPCSGEGLFRKSPESITEWSEEAVAFCAQRQKSILRDVWDSLKPGGILIYSTCTFNEQENEENVSWIVEHLGAEVLPFVYDPQWGLTPGKVGYHCFPHKMHGEGMYFCILRKNDDAQAQPYVWKRLRRLKIKGRTHHLELREWLQDPDAWHFTENERFVMAYPNKWQRVVETINDNMTCIVNGFGLAEIKKKGILPQHSACMHKDIKKENWVQIELTKEQAIGFLRQETNFVSTENLPQDLLLFTFRGIPLGYGRNIGDRINNLYPKEWKIKNA